MAEIEERYADGEITNLDGVSVDYDDWHFNVRPSNTEPLLRLNLESLVSRAGHGAPARRGARAHPRVTAGIHCLPIPTPFAVGRVNCYLIEDDPLTLVDTGPELRQGARRARAGAARARAPDRGPRADRRHPPAHRPHRACSASSPAAPAPRSCALDLLAPVLEDFGADAERDDEFAEALMRATASRATSAPRCAPSRGRSAPGAAARRSTAGCADGEELEFADRTLQALHRPGHSPSDTLFWDAERAMLLGGDHLIKHISSNPLITRPLGGAVRRAGRRAPAGAVTYLASLRETREMPVEHRAPRPRRAGHRPRRR